MECRWDRDVLRLASEVENEEQANVLIDVLTAWLMQQRNVGREDAEDTIRVNLGYLGGYADHETRARIERLFKVEHPFFGSIAKNGPPTPEHAFALGIAYGERMRELWESDKGS